MERVAETERGEADRILKVESTKGDAQSKALQGRGIADQRQAMVADWCEFRTTSLLRRYDSAARDAPAAGAGSLTREGRPMKRRQYRKSILTREDGRDAKRDEARDLRRDKFRDAKRDEARDAERDEERDEARDAERDEARDEVRDTERDEARDAERDETGDEEWDGAMYPECSELWCKMLDEERDETRNTKRERIRDAERNDPSKFRGLDRG